MANSSSRSGFTVIELLSAMAVLIFVVMMMTRIFTETTSIWTRGTRQVQSAAEGRAIMDFIVKDMTQAIADDVVTFKMSSGDTSLYSADVYDERTDEVCFVGLVRSGDSYYKRTGNQFVYFVAPMLDENSDPIPNRYRLSRVRRTRSMFLTSNNRADSAYDNRNWWQKMPPDYYEQNISGLHAIETIAENVAALEFWAYNKAGSLVADYNSADEDDLLPLWVDVYLELLSEDDAIKVAALWDGDESAAKELIARSAKRYTTRVFFPNRERALAFNNE